MKASYFSSPGLRPSAALLLLALAWALPAAADIGQIKVAKGEVAVERDGQLLQALVGMRLAASDVLKTGPTGSVGVTMSDDTLLSAGPNSVLALDRYEFDATTSQGRLDASNCRAAPVSSRSRCSTR